MLAAVSEHPSQNAFQQTALVPFGDGNIQHFVKDCKLCTAFPAYFFTNWIFYFPPPPFLPVILFCMAALIFPIGFYINEVGGQPYKLPNNTVVGSSYVLFVLSIFFTIVGLLFAGKVCLPG